MSESKITRTITVQPTVEEVAKCFAGLGSEEQVRCLSLLAEESKKWGNAQMQWAYIGNALKESTQITKDMIHDWNYFMEAGIDG